MLDTFEIVTTSGVVLWSRSFSTTSPAIINGLITNVFIEERTLPGAGIADDVSAANNPPYKHEQHTVKWTTSKELGVIFVVSSYSSGVLAVCTKLGGHFADADRIAAQAVYRSLLHLSWIDKLVDNIKTLFVDLYGDQLRKPHTTIVECHFDEYFDQQLQELEKTAINRDTAIAEATAFLEKAPASVAGEVRDEPPPLPGLLSRGKTETSSFSCRSWLI